MFSILRHEILTAPLKATSVEELGHSIAAKVERLAAMVLPWIISADDPTNGERMLSTLSCETFAERLKITLD